MTIKVGDRVPDGTLTEFIDTETEGCTLGPNAFQVSDLVKGKKIALFAVPGAFTPTCSAKHLPSFIAKADALKAKGVDEIACTAVNDAFVMGAWRKANDADAVTMLADGNGAFAHAIGLEMDGSKFGLGTRGQRFSMLVRDGVVEQLNVEAPGEFKVSSAEHMLDQM